MTASTRRINSLIVYNLGKSTCKETGETNSVNIAIVQQFFIE